MTSVAQTDRRYDLIVTRSDGQVRVLEAGRKIIVVLKDDSEEKIRGTFQNLNSRQISVLGKTERIIDISDIAEITARYDPLLIGGGVLVLASSAGISGGFYLATRAETIGDVFGGVLIAIISIPLIFVGVGLLTSKKKYNLTEDWTVSLVEVSL